MDDRPFSPRRRRIVLILIPLAVTLFLTWSFGPFDTLLTLSFATPASIPLTTVREQQAQDVLSYSPTFVLNGPPTTLFRDNLKPDLMYITSWPSAGWTNDVITYGNLIYLGLITERIPVIPHFTPSHVQGGTIPFGDVFNVTRLSEAINMPVIEWRDVKREDSLAVEPLGCWNVWETVQTEDPFPRRASAPLDIKLDLSYTKTPESVKYWKVPNERHATFWGLSQLAFPQARSQSLGNTIPSPILHKTRQPDEQMLCFDYLYYVCAQQPFEYEYDYSPAWRFVAQHMHWTTALEDLGLQYVRKTLGVSDDEPIPPWITIHARRRDFDVFCQGRPLQDCFASLPAFARRVGEVQKEIMDKHGIKVEHVIMTSDERDPLWWDDVRKTGWYVVDHSETASRFGPWYPVFVDAVIQSLGMGLVGTDYSTMSLMAAKRVESWQNGATRFVKWGVPGADD